MPARLAECPPVVALEGACQHALQNARQSKHIEGQIIGPILRRDRRPTAATAVIRHALGLARNVQRRRIQSAETAKLFGRQMITHAKIRQIDEGMAQRRQLPVQHRQDSRFAWVKYRVIEPEIAVHDSGFLVGGNVLRQPLDEPLHGVDRFGCRGAILLRPARHLTLDVAAGLAVITQARGGVVHRVQRGDDPRHFIVDGTALGFSHFGQRGIPKKAPLDIVHHVERGADHRRVLA